MFVYYFVAISPGEYAEVESAALHTLDGLPGAAEVAYREGEELRAQLGVGNGSVAKTVRLHVGAPVRGERQTVIPLRWEATGTSGLFPRMDAELVLNDLGPGLTHLAFRGSYDPPLGPVGRFLDRAILHRVAELTVKNLVDRLAAAIADGMGEGPASSPEPRPGLRRPQARTGP